MERSRSSPEGDGEREPAGPVDELRARVEEKYDFDDFRPRDMDEMSPEEWDAVFDPDAWITGSELLDRVEDDLESRIAYREVFAVVERQRVEGVEAERLLAYSDEGYAAVYEDGSVEGRGTILRDVKASVALCSMPDYDVPEPPEDASLPDPEDVPEGSGDLANRLVQAIAAVQFVAGLVLLVGVGAFGVGGVDWGEGREIAVIVGLLFLAFGVFLLFVVANARLSDRFRAEEYRDRLRSVGDGLESAERERPIEEIEARVREDEADGRDERESPAN